MLGTGLRGHVLTVLAIAVVLIAVGVPFSVAIGVAAMGACMSMMLMGGHGGHGPSTGERREPGSPDRP